MKTTIFINTLSVKSLSSYWDWTLRAVTNTTIILLFCSLDLVWNPTNYYSNNQSFVYILHVIYAIFLNNRRGLVGSVLAY